MKKMFGAALGLLLTAAVCGAGTVTAWADVTDGTAAAGRPLPRRRRRPLRNRRYR